jgi:hypothetical protein
MRVEIFLDYLLDVISSYDLKEALYRQFSYSHLIAGYVSIVYDFILTFRQQVNFSKNTELSKFSRWLNLANIIYISNLSIEYDNKVFTGFAFLLYYFLWFIILDNKVHIQIFDLGRCETVQPFTFL